MIRKTGAILILIGMFLPFLDIVNVSHLVERNYAFTVIGILSILAGVILLVISRQKQKSEPDFIIPASGKLEVTVLGVTRGLRTSESEQEQYYIIAEGVDEKGRKRTFTSEPFDYYPGRQVIGRKSEVIFKGKDPDDYQLVTDKLLK